MSYELAIIGGGPAGVAAGVYAARKKIKTILITDEFGGQSSVSEDVRNWIGTKAISGRDLAKNLEDHLKDQEDIDIKESVLVKTIARQDNGFELKLSNGETVQSRFVLLTLGSRRRRLDVPGEAKFEGRGVVYCSTCDAPLFKNKTVAVVGSGNAGLEAVIDLLPYASKIYLMVRSETMRGDAVSQEKVKKADKVEVILNTEIKEVLGESYVTGLKYLDKAAKTEKTLALDGVFVEIGSIPNSDIAKNLGVTLTHYGEVVVDHKTQRAADGLWAAGDVTDVLYKQNNISMGDAVKAVLNIYETIHKGDAAR